MTEWRAFETAEQAGREVAHEIYTGLSRAVSQGDRYLLGCPGGRSPRPVYLALAQLLARQPLDCSQLYIVMMDEYLLPAPSGGWQTPPPSQHYSCLGFAQREIVGLINQGLPPGWQVTPQQILLPNPQDPAAYEQTLEQLGGINLFVLASGAGDGHVAFNPAGSLRSSRTRVIELAQQTRLDNLYTFPLFASLEEVPTHGVSVGIATIAQYSRRTILLLFGRQKQLAYHRIRAVTDYDPNWPASVVHACLQPSVYYCLKDV